MRLLSNRENFIRYDHTTSLITPITCRSANQFAKLNKDITSIEYSQFFEMRTKLEKSFNDPFRITKIAGGYSSNLLFHREPEEKAWELLADYFRSNGWDRMTYRIVGSFKTVTTVDKVTTGRSEGLNYKINIFEKKGE